MCTLEFLDSIDVSIELLKSLLENHVKPCFLTNPHPQLNPATGRALNRIAGGHMASQDYYDEQVWKDHLGLSNVVSWCIRHIPVSIRSLILSYALSISLFADGEF